MMVSRLGDTVTVHVGIEWNKAPATFTPEFNGKLESPVVVEFQARLWSLGGLSDGEAYSPDRPAHVGVSIDGMAWMAVTTGTVFPNRFGLRALAYRDKLWVFGGEC